MLLDFNVKRHKTIPHCTKQCRNIRIFKTKRPELIHRIKKDNIGCGIILSDVMVIHMTYRTQWVFHMEQHHLASDSCHLGSHFAETDTWTLNIHEYRNDFEIYFIVCAEFMLQKGCSV